MLLPRGSANSVAKHKVDEEGGVLGECGASGPQGERNVVCLHIVTSAGEGLKVCVCVCVLGLKRS